MYIEYEFKNEEEKESLIKANEGFKIVKIAYLYNKNIIVFLDNSIESKIDILEAENLRLKEVEKEQDKMIMDNAYKMTILEASMGGM